MDIACPRGVPNDRSALPGLSTRLRGLTAPFLIFCLVAPCGAQPANVGGDGANILVEPAKLTNESTTPGFVEMTLTAAPGRLDMLPGRATDVYAYNGQVPGPTIDVTEGDSVVIHFHNRLPEPTTIHWHGLHIPAVSDGNPMELVQPGQDFEYRFRMQPGTAGTYWYHPHPDHRTTGQVARGLFGTFIVRAADNPLPPSIPEKLIILSDNRFLDDGSIDMPDRSSPQGQIDEVNGREGNVMFVNGQIRPIVEIRPGQVQRWRIVNASAARVYRLALEGQSMLYVGDDDGLFERPVEVDEFTIANSERAEFLIRGADEPGHHTVLQALPYDRYVPQTRPPDWDHPRDLLTLQTTEGPPAAPVEIPDVLRPIEPLDPADAVDTKVVVMTQGLINGKAMDMSRVDMTARLGTTEIWEVENLVGMDHPFHLHGFSFQILSRNGVPEPFLSWQDTVNVPKHESVRLIVHYDDFPGLWMFHCHILDHEDQGMMGILQVK